MNKISQEKIILEAMKSGDKITPLDALRLCGSLRLSGRIYDLREKGYNIKTNMVVRNGSRVAQYELIKD